MAGLLMLPGAVLGGPPRAELQPARVKQIHTFTREEGTPVFARMALGPDGRLYGTSTRDGPAGGGTIFRMSTHGHVTVLHAFSNTGVHSPRFLLLGADGDFYGTTDLPPALFRMTPHGKVTVLYTSPRDEDDCLAVGISGLLQARDGDFYLTSDFGFARDGCIVRVSPHGHAKTLHVFQGGEDGLIPTSLVESPDGYLYGLTARGGKFNLGTFFRMHHNGRVDILHSFGWQRDGRDPTGLVEGSDGFFYGVTPLGGPTHAGTVFRASRDGEVSVLHAFERQTDGKSPRSLVLGRDGHLYGLTAERYISQHRPTAFRLTRDGSFTVLHAFDDTVDNEHVDTHGMTEGEEGHFYWVSLADSSSTAYQLRIAP
ncbi:MAG: choice-of-anchor tandem repeat GloVer-containing protein [Pseudomonadota bacterium]